MRVLYASHTQHVSGGEHSLLDLVAALPPGVCAGVACPPGDLSARLDHSHELPNIDASLRLHPWYTPRALARMAYAGWALRRVAARTGAELVHANSIRAGLIALVARALGGPPVVVHVRDRLPEGAASRMTMSLIVRRAAAVVANSRYTLGGLPRSGRAVQVAVASPVDLDRFDLPSGEPASSRERLGIPPDAPVLGVVGQLTPWKGQDDAIRVLAHVRRSRPGAQLVIAGSAKFVSRETRFDNPTYVRGLRALCDELGVADAVHFVGERGDVPELLRAMDVLLVPSWTEPFGRVVIEGMAASVPVVATSEGGPAEIIQDGETGLLVPPRTPDAWAAAVERLLAAPELRISIAAAGRERVADYAVERHVERLLDVYRGVLGEVEGPQNGWDDFCTNGVKIEPPREFVRGNGLQARRLPRNQDHV
jgi:L-malate glycosyltransferase